MVRPEPGASATVARAQVAGIEAVAIPLFEVSAVAWDVPEASEYDALLLTSANAARHGGPRLSALAGLPTYCVGEATAAAARAAGLSVARVGVGDADALLGQMPPGGRLLHLTGTNYQVVPRARQIAVYASRAIDPPPPLDALRGGVAMVHSPRAGKRLAALVNERGDISIAAISKAAGEACGDGWRIVKTIEQPSDSALLALASDLCQDRAR